MAIGLIDTRRRGVMYEEQEVGISFFFFFSSGGPVFSFLCPLLFVSCNF